MKKRIKFKLFIWLSPLLLFFIGIFAFIAVLSIFLQSGGSSDHHGNAPVAGEQLETAQKLYDYLTTKEHATKEGACGALAVFQRESSFDVTAKNPAGGVAGIAQWSGWNGNTVNGSRITQGGFINASDDSTLTLDHEQSLIDYELSNGYKKVKDLASKATDPVQSAKDWSKYYEGVDTSDSQTALAKITNWAILWNAYFTGGGDGGSGSVDMLNPLLGTKVGTGQCYALSNWYCEQISHFTLYGMCAKNIGSDNLVAFTAHGWKVVFNPTSASDLKSGAIVCWGSPPETNSPYGHTGVIDKVNGNTYTTYEQMGDGAQKVVKENRTFDTSITCLCYPPSS
ncbi:phage tail tip lysozyme [Lactococcus lactis]|uniref:phage tail tip lysozyme n=1 Tax=Lactococcus lactis TaxID=1358 RepID=UPI002378F50C|nr:phage tail tip lysozyme [Lactococcus lactis]WDA68458.1 phage tail tip lysozyme [Lactococcus lactis]